MVSHRLINFLRPFFVRHRTLIFLLVAAAFVLPEVTVYFHFPGRGADIAGYIAAGKDALAGAPLYAHSAPGKNNTWPPFFSLFIMPLAISQMYLGTPVTKELWYFFNFFCLIGVVQLWTHMLFGQRPAFCSKKGFDFSSPKVFVPLLLVLPPLVNNFFMLQINVFILFLVTFGLYMMTHSRHAVSGLSFGLAASLKAFPALIVLYLLVRRQWKTAAYAVAAGVLFSLIPVLSYGIEPFVALVKQWLSMSLVQTLVIDNIRHNNQSLYALWYRLLVYQLGIAEPGSTLLKSVNFLSIGAITVAAMTIFAQKRFNPTSRRTLAEFAGLCIMMTIFPPIGWKHYFVFMYPAAALIWADYHRCRGMFQSRWVSVLSIAWSLLILVPYCSGRVASRWFQALSNYTAAALCLLLLIGFLMLKGDREGRFTSAGTSGSPT